MKPLLFFIAAFLCGSFPTAYLTAKWLKGIDIRTQGSGNVGATNAFRVLGKGPGAFVFAVDFIKGALPAYYFARLSGAASDAYPETALIFGVAAILGHVFTPFLGFRGGKGVATAAGVICAALPLFFVASFAAWLIVFCLTRMVSISSLIAGIFLLVICVLTHQSNRLLAIFAGLLIFIIWTHRSNISRLINRSESKF